MDKKTDQKLGRQLLDMLKKIPQLVEKTKNPKEIKRLQETSDQLEAMISKITETKIESESKEFQVISKQFEEASQTIEKALKKIDTISKTISNISTAINALKKILV